MKFASTAFAILMLLLPLELFAAKQKVLFVRKAGGFFNEVHEAMAKDLGSKFELVDFNITQETSYDDFKNKVGKETSDLLVLMDNLPLEFAMKYNAEQKTPQKKIKGVALMALNLKTILKGNQDFCGIAFEPPPYSLMTQFRFISQKTVKNVLVFYRKSLFQDRIDEATRQLKAEGITLEAVNVEQAGTSQSKVEEFLEKNVKEYAKAAQKYDALWVLLDSSIINQKLFSSVWTQIAKDTTIPFVTGTENLIAKDMHFGSFAISPNLGDLAGQADQQVTGILLEHVTPSTFGVEDVVSVNKFLNKGRAKEQGLKLKEDHLGDVNVVE